MTLVEGCFLGLGVVVLILAAWVTLRDKSNKPLGPR